MSRFGKVISSTPVNIALFVIAAILLLGSIVGGTQAALSYYSDTYLARLSASDIGVTLMENDKEVAWRDYTGDGTWREQTWEEPTQATTGQVQARLLNELIPVGSDTPDQTLQVGKSYKEVLRVKNSGTITQYVSMELLKYWEKPLLDDKGNAVYDPAGNPVYTKDTTLDPGLITINYDERYIKGSKSGGDWWEQDPESSTVEREVFVYKHKLRAEEETMPLTKSVSVNSDVANLVSTTTTPGQTITNADGTTTTTSVVTTTFEYNDMRFCLEATVYASQDHNILDAIRSAWGKIFNLNSDGTLSVN